MKHMKRLSILILIFFALGVELIQAEKDYHPPTYTDEGVCPFECCKYGEWTVKKATDLHSAPDFDSKKIGIVNGGDKVKAVTGIVIVESPGKVEALKDYKAYKKGDTIWVYTYIGEGFFKVWFAGKMYEEDVSFLLHGENGGYVGCVVKGTCWGKVLSKPQATWWIKIKTKEGLEGWSNQSQNFGNMDSCS